MDEFPRPAKPRDKAVNWQSTAPDVTMLEHFKSYIFLVYSSLRSYLYTLVPTRQNSFGNLQFGRLFPASCLKREDTNKTILIQLYLTYTSICTYVYVWRSALSVGVSIDNHQIILYRQSICNALATYPQLTTCSPAVRGMGTD